MAVADDGVGHAGQVHAICVGAASWAPHRHSLDEQPLDSVDAHVLHGGPTGGGRGGEGRGGQGGEGGRDVFSEHRSLTIRSD